MFPIVLIWGVFQSSLSCILAIFHLTSPPIFPLHKGDFLLNLMRFPDTAPAHETGAPRDDLGILVTLFPSKATAPTSCAPDLVT